MIQYLLNHLRATALWLANLFHSPEELHVTDPNPYGDAPLPEPTHNRRRVLFICKKRMTAYGELTSSGLHNSARMVAYELNHIGHTAEVIDVVDGNDIDRECHRFKPTHVVLEAFWCPPEKLQELAGLYPGVKWTVRNHSKLPFLAGEGIALEWAYRYQGPANYQLSSNTPEAAREFQVIGVPCGRLENIYQMTDRGYRIAQGIPRRHPGELHVGLFGAIRLLKNHLLQAVAAIQVAEAQGSTLYLHINVGRQEMQGSEPLKNLRALFAHQGKHRLVEHEWLEHGPFLDLVGEMDACLQVSYTETFNIVAADAVSQGIPVVGSREIHWLPERTQADPNSSLKIARGLAHVLYGDTVRLQQEAWGNLQRHNQGALRTWEAWLE